MPKSLENRTGYIDNVRTVRERAGTWNVLCVFQRQVAENKLETGEDKMSLKMRKSPKIRRHYKNYYEAKQSNSGRS